MMRMLACITLLTICAGCKEQETDTVITDPVAWTNAFFLAEAGEAGETTPAEMDLDQDGIDELVVETTAGAGTGGTNHAVFRRIEGGYVLLGTFGGKGCTPLPHDPAGNVRIKTYWHLSAREGIISWLVSRDGEFIEEKHESWHAPDDPAE